MRPAASEYVVVIETLKSGGLSDRDGAVQYWVDGQSTMARNDRSGKICVQPSIGDRSLTRLDAPDLCDDCRSVPHRAAVEKGSPIGQR